MERTKGKLEVKCWKHKYGPLVYDIVSDEGILVAENVHEEYAHFIAAAPDLLEAVKVLQEQVIDCKEYFWGSGSQPEQEAMANSIIVGDTAIAQAEEK